MKEGAPFRASLSPAKPGASHRTSSAVFASLHHEEGGAHGLSGGPEGSCLRGVIPCSREPVAQSGLGDGGRLLKGLLTDCSRHDMKCDLISTLVLRKRGAALSRPRVLRAMPSPAGAAGCKELWGTPRGVSCQAAGCPGMLRCSGRSAEVTMHRESYLQTLQQAREERSLNSHILGL